MVKAYTEVNAIDGHNVVLWFMHSVMCGMEVESTAAPKEGSRWIGRQIKPWHDLDVYNDVTDVAGCSSKVLQFQQCAQREQIRRKALSEEMMGDAFNLTDNDARYETRLQQQLRSLSRQAMHWYLWQWTPNQN